MDRGTWTDERLDDLAGRMDAGFERVAQDIRDLRSETSRQFAQTHRRFDELHRVMIRFNAGMTLCVLGTLLTLVGTLVVNSLGTS